MNAPQATALTIVPLNPPRDGFLPDGGDDQADGGNLFLFASNERYFSLSSGSLPSYTFAADVLGDFTVSARLDFLQPNGTTTSDTLGESGNVDFVYARQMFTFTNNTNVEIPLFDIRLTYGLGSDDATTVASTSSGDTTIGNDIWIVTDDGVDGGPSDNGNSSDPALGLVFADGSNETPLNIDLFENDDILTDFRLSFAPNETVSILAFYVSRNDTDTFSGSATRAQTEADVAALLADPDLIFSGLSQQEADSVVNFTIPEPTSLSLLGLAALALAARRRRLL